MIENKFEKIEKLIQEKKIDEAQFELSKIQNQFLKDTEYLYLRSKIFYLNKIYYLAIDTLLIALEFKEADKYYELLSEIYKVIENHDLSKKFLDPNLRTATANFLKDELSGIYRKK